MHFIFDCTPNEQERNLTFNLLGIHNTTSLTTVQKTRILYDILENNKHEDDLKHFAKFIYESERKRYDSDRK